MGCDHCCMTASDERVQGADYELQAPGCACARIEYEDGYELVVEDWAWDGTCVTVAVPITHCPWCGEEL